MKRRKNRKPRDGMDGILDMSNGALEGGDLGELLLGKKKRKRKARSLEEMALSI